MQKSLLLFMLVFLFILGETQNNNFINSPNQPRSNNFDPYTQFNPRRTPYLNSKYYIELTLGSFTDEDSDAGTYSTLAFGVDFVVQDRLSISVELGVFSFSYDDYFIEGETTYFAIKPTYKLSNEHFVWLKWGKTGEYTAEYTTDYGEETITYDDDNSTLRGIGFSFNVSNSLSIGIEIQDIPAFFVTAETIGFSLKARF